jgi:hypothetical protein
LCQRGQLASVVTGRASQAGEQLGNVTDGWEFGLIAELGSLLDLLQEQGSRR